jgi:two-component system osmolarity sensor histidine kinase EnvZ
MFFRWLKRYMPRSLYGRAALILGLPVVLLQLVVSVVFIQRHLEDVTLQMSLTAVREMKTLVAQIDAAGSAVEALEQSQPLLGSLQIGLRFPAETDIPDTDQIRWFDYSGRVVAQTFRSAFPQTRVVSFPDTGDVRVFAETALGPAEIWFSRRRVTAAAPHQLIVTMAFFGVLVTGIAFLYLRNQLRPIARLADAAQAFGRGRNVPFWPSGATEVRVAGNAFLDMRARIERQIEQRTMMLSGVSHDLRTPLTRLKLGLSMIDEDDADPLLQDVDEMQELLDAFLEFSKGASQAKPEEVDPAALIERIVKDARREGKDVSLGECVGTGSVMLQRTGIRRAVENLIGNAVRYGSKASVSMVLTEKSLRIRVEDDGPGIPAEMRDEAIRPFSRLDPARNQNQGTGVGLGLAIVADITRAHGGALRLGDSKALGGLQADIVIAR